MRKLAIALLFAACGPSSYYYSFDLTDPGAKNAAEAGARDSLEDADVKSEIVLDPVNFQAIALDVTNKTDQPLVVRGDQIYLVTPPDGNQLRLHPDSPLTPVEAGRRLAMRLVPFTLPAQGPLAAAYDTSKWELVVPMTVRGQPREYHYHLVAKVKKL